MLEAARHAGCTAAATALARQDVGEAFNAVLSVAGTLLLGRPWGAATIV
jgi:hypothetical protein